MCILLTNYGFILLKVLEIPHNCSFINYLVVISCDVSNNFAISLQIL